MAEFAKHEEQHKRFTVVDHPLLQKSLKNIQNPIANMGIWMDIPNIEESTFKQLKEMGYVGVVVGEQKRDFVPEIILIEINPPSIFEMSQRMTKYKQKLQETVSLLKLDKFSEWIRIEKAVELIKCLLEEEKQKWV
mgnify:CR=1 FL=1